MINKNDQGIGLMGYDPVCYFENNPQKGVENISCVYQGIQYFFINGIHKYQFELSPEKFLPQYGGFCATAMSEGKIFPVNPETFSISNGKLYLFYDGEGGNMKSLWDKEEKARLQQADKNWTEQNYVIV